MDNVFGQMMRFKSDVKFEEKVLNERFLVRRMWDDVFEVEDLEGEMQQLLNGESLLYNIYRCKAGSRTYLLFENISRRAGFVVEGRWILSYFIWIRDYIKCVVNGEGFGVMFGSFFDNPGWWEIDQTGSRLFVTGYVSYPEIRFVMHGEKLTPIFLVTLRNRGDVLYLFEYRTLYEGDKIFVDSGFNSLNVIRSLKGNVEGKSILPNGEWNSVFNAPISVYVKFFDYCKFHRAGKQKIVISLEGGRPLVDYSEYLRYLNQEEFSFTLVAERDDGFYISPDFKHWIKFPADMAKGGVVFEDGWIDFEYYSCGNIVCEWGC